MQQCKDARTTVRHVTKSEVLKKKDDDSDNFVQFVKLQDEKEVEKWNECFQNIAGALFSDCIKSQGGKLIKKKLSNLVKCCTPIAAFAATETPDAQKRIPQFRVWHVLAFLMALRPRLTHL